MLDVPSRCAYTSCMVRTQVQLTPEQARRLRGMARQQGVSLAQLVRQSVDRLLNDERLRPAARYARAAKLVGAFPDRAGAKDLSRRHDAYLDDRVE
jgi:hypothetical protein